ncbi:MAG: hypothetical protein PVH68_09890 [Armatimonadota bacterium]|jgi:hypothetical protein
MADKLPTLVVLAGIEYRTHYDAGSVYLSRRSSVDQSVVTFSDASEESLVGGSEEEPAGLAVSASGRVIVELHDSADGLTVYYSDEGGEPGSWLVGG